LQTLDVNERLNPVSDCTIITYAALRYMRAPHGTTLPTTSPTPTPPTKPTSAEPRLSEIIYDIIHLCMIS